MKSTIGEENKKGSAVKTPKVNILFIIQEHPDFPKEQQKLEKHAVTLK